MLTRFGPSGEGLSLGGMLPSRSKVQHLLGVDNSLGKENKGAGEAKVEDPSPSETETSGAEIGFEMENGDPRQLSSTRWTMLQLWTTT